MNHLNNLIGQERNPEEYIHIADQGLKSYRKSHHWAFIKNLYQYNFRILSSIALDLSNEK